MISLFSVLIMLNGCYICWTTESAISSDEREGERENSSGELWVANLNSDRPDRDCVD